MTGSKPFPINPGFLAAIKSTLSIESDEDASQVTTIRKFLDEMACQVKVPKVDREDRIIEYGDIKVKISILRPVGSKDEVLPVVLFMHGGGWVLGSFNTSASLTHQLVNKLNACIIFVDYSLSPEVRYPVALEECYTALCWTRDNAKSIHVDPTRLAVCGDSAGGNLATALAILDKDRGNTSISYQILFYPVTAAEFDNETYNEYKDNEYVSKQLMQYFWNVYLNNEQERTLPTVAPLAAPVDVLKGLPPALIFTAEIDVLRTEAELYAKKLTEAGVHNLCVRYLGVEHGFASESGYESQAEIAIAQTAFVLKKHWDMD